ncbi:Tn3 family transposase [Photobacterium frigidiphilum]|uniref:Tn3 family transposase n=1 Tax=Photobacterium frigidiphilum TaxID=264736 RepID=A0A2T3J723_9GAMM|nr:Tn3 family transposase [Photobacterium frigidiphilum]PSU44554.1 Tn3 family transposase [Photobacterium frigidiphilum]
MPIEFLSEEQKNQYGCFTGEPNDTQLARYFHLDDTALALINKRRGDYNRLGFALQLTTVRFLGTFLPDPTDVPINVLNFIAQQVDTGTDNLEQYMSRKVTRYSHSTEIQSFYGYHEFNNAHWRFRLTRLLYSRAWISNERPSLMFDFATAWLIHHKVLLPGVSTLSRLISEIRERAVNRLWKRLASLPTEEQKEKLEALLQVPEGQRASRFDYYRKGPVTISSPAFITALERYIELKNFDLNNINLSHIPPVRLKNLARHAGVISMHKIARMPDEKRIAILVAFVKAFEVMALDDALDILDLLITGIAGEAKKLGQKKRLRTLKDLDKSALALAAICALILNENTDDSQLRDAIYNKCPKDKLAQSIATINAIARPSSDNFHDEMVEQYGKVRRFLPRLLKDIVIKAAPAGEITLEAFNYLAELDNSRKQTLDNPPLEIITSPWKRLVYDKEGKVTKRGYTLCFLDKLQDSLRRRDVFIENSDRWGDPRSKLLQGAEWQANRIQVCRSLGHPVQANDAIIALTRQLDAAYKQVAAHFDDNDAVRLDHSGKHPTLTITNLDKLDEPASLTLLSNQVSHLLPNVDLTELLLEIHALTGFLDEFTHVSESNARADDLTTSVCAVLIAEACNIGLDPLIKSHIPALTRHRLSWVKQNYVRAETLVKSNARLVNHQATLPLAKKWGGGDVASADGMRFVTPVRTVNAGPNKKYFGSSRGITWYNFISDQFSGFHGIVIPGTLRDSMFVLEGLLEQQTGLNPTEIMTDTTGTSDIVFGLFWLLGYQFSPRLADAGESVFWRIDKEADYGALNDLARGVLNPQKIHQHWDDMMRIAGSLKLGTVQASELIRSLLKSDRPSSLAQAIIEVGRINKTIYLLNYIDDEDYRRRILTQLNRGEGRHSVARVICHGQRGEIRKRYREGQEDQLGALGLVTNAVILWNTIYMQSALDHLQHSIEIKEEDKARLSPLGYGHINVLGHYSFTLAEQVMKGELRPLNQSSGYIDTP